MRSETLLSVTTFNQVDMIHQAYCNIVAKPQFDKPVRHAFHSDLSFKSSEIKS